MQLHEQQEHFEALVDKMRKTMFSKGNDYSVVSDRLSNFKQAGSVTNTHPAKVALIIASVKISRICALLDSGREPSNESRKDSALDLSVYSILADAVLSEQETASLAGGLSSVKQFPREAVQSTVELTPQQLAQVKEHVSKWQDELGNRRLSPKEMAEIKKFITRKKRKPYTSTAKPTAKKRK